MATVSKFFKIMFSDWASRLSGPASVPLAILALWGPSSTQKVAYGLLAVVLGFVSAYRIWLKEHDQAESLSREIETLKDRHFSERPQLGLNVVSVRGHRGWADATEAKNTPVHFSIQHLSGRIPTSVHFEPIISKRGNYALLFESLPHVDPTVQTVMNYEVWEAVQQIPPVGKSPNATTIDNIGWGTMLGFFVDDTPADMKEARYDVVARFKDGDEERLQSFHLVFDMARYRFLSDTA